MQRGSKLKAELATPVGVKGHRLLDEVMAMIAFAVTVAVAVPIAIFVTPLRVVGGWFKRRNPR
jgi:hypothetical protein